MKLEFYVRPRTLWDAFYLGIPVGLGVGVLLLVGTYVAAGSPACGGGA